MRLRFFIAFLFFGLFFIQIVSSEVLFEFNLKEVYETGEIINGNWSVNFSEGEIISINLNVTFDLGNETFNNGSVFLNNTTNFWSFSDLFSDINISKEGTYNFTFIVKNGTETFFNHSGNISVIPLNIVIPLETLEIFDISPSGYITDESPEISFRTSIRAICRYSDIEEDYMYMDGMDFTNDTFHRKELEGLDTGSYKYYIECHDFKDQFSFNEVSFKIDKEEPSVVLHRPRGLIDYNETINFTYTPEDDYSLRSCELYLNLSGGWKREKYDSRISNNKLNSFVVKNLNLDYKEYYWKVKCIDKAGNNVESDKLSFIVKKVYSGASVSDESSVESNLDINNPIVELESENSKKYEESEDFSESESPGNFITGAAISNLGGKIKNIFSSFIFIITILALFFIVGIHQYTKTKIIEDTTKPVILHNIPKQDFMKKDEIPPQTIHKQIHPQTNERLIGNEVNSFNRFDWRESAVKGNLVEHFHWKIMMTRRRKHISRDRFAKILGETETRIKLIEEGFLPQDYNSLISKIEDYLGINLRK